MHAPVPSLCLTSASLPITSMTNKQKRKSQTWGPHSDRDPNYIKESYCPSRNLSGMWVINLLLLFLFLARFGSTLGQEAGATEQCTNGSCRVTCA